MSDDLEFGAPSGPESVEVPDAARAVLSRMRAGSRTVAARSSEPNVRPANTYRAARRGRRTMAGFSGPGPDARDPLQIGSAWRGLVAENEWSRALQGAAVFGLWPQIVGATNAEHAQPESFEPVSGVLLIKTSSTAWAEQLRLMMPSLRVALDANLGNGVVREIRVSGPTPPRIKGRLRVRGKGPRDTYG